MCYACGNLYSKPHQVPVDINLQLHCISSFSCMGNNMFGLAKRPPARQHATSPADTCLSFLLTVSTTSTTRLIDLSDYPLHSLLKPLTSFGRSRLDLPDSVPDRTQIQSIRNFIRTLCIHKILLIGKNKHRNLSQFILLKQLAQLHTSLFQSSGISAINDVDESVTRIKIIAPIWSDHLLPSNIPDVKLKALMHQRFNIETLSGHDVSDVLIRKFFENCCFSRVIQTKHKNSKFLVGTLQFTEASEESHIKCLANRGA
mmetsp:Transcript_1585/g.3089  ORF Transcript_1585/g.3089 Transcript_1585/m.3089 type:complete len:258 (+) Transcript_1585:139-912(+)